MKFAKKSPMEKLRSQKMFYYKSMLVGPKLHAELSYYAKFLISFWNYTEIVVYSKRILATSNRSQK